ncbi:MAG TPA: PIN domain-containing protein, partial [Herbaspirillum sp.]|nr:PIN domain-containing protein [Herbaspirillum sp.]
MARTHLFVDSNVFLDFYSYAKDDLGQLKRLIEYLHVDGICLHLPQHVINELERNRETKLKTSAEQFKKENFPTAIPRHMQDYPQAKEYSAAVDTALKKRTALINQ